MCYWIALLLLFYMSFSFFLFIFISLEIALIMATRTVSHQTEKVPVGGTTEVKTNLPKLKARLEGHGEMKNDLKTNGSPQSQKARHTNMIITILFKMALLSFELILSITGF